MSTVRVTVNPAGVQALFEPGSEIGRLAARIGTQTVALARATGPRRTGRLVGSLRPRGAMGKYQYTETVSTNVEYARFVMGGTGPRIYPKAGAWLKVPRGPAMALGHGRRSKTAAGEFTFKRSVRGQRANPFLERAFETTLRSHGFAVSF